MAIAFFLFIFIFFLSGFKLRLSAGNDLIMAKHCGKISSELCGKRKVLGISHKNKCQRGDYGTDVILINIWPAGCTGILLY